MPADLVKVYMPHSRSEARCSWFGCSDSHSTAWSGCAERSGSRMATNRSMRQVFPNLIRKEETWDRFGIRIIACQLLTKGNILKEFLNRLCTSITNTLLFQVLSFPCPFTQLFPPMEVIHPQCVSTLCSNLFTIAIFYIRNQFIIDIIDQMNNVILYS